MPDAAETLRHIGGAGLTLAIAESLTGGLLCARLTDVPGASSVLRGGVVAYATDAKRDVLGVPADVLAQHGAVSAKTAEDMALRVRETFGSDIGLSTTGVAGPDEQEGKRVGSVFIAIADAQTVVSHAFNFHGSRADIREQTVQAAFDLLCSVKRA